MSSPGDTAAQIAALLNALTQPDTNAIRSAEVALKPLLKDARSVPALVEVLKGRGIQVRRKDWTIRNNPPLLRNHHLLDGTLFGWLREPQPERIPPS